MIRMPLGVAITFNIILLLAAFSGMLGPGGIFILIVNIILTIPPWLRHRAVVEEKKELERVQKTQSANIFINNMVQLIMHENASFQGKISALVLLNDFFIVKKNRKYIDDLKDFAGNKINEYTMSLFIANHAEHLMNHPQATDDFKEILRDLSQNRKSFATKRLRSTLKRALKKSKQEHQSI